MKRLVVLMLLMASAGYTLAAESSQDAPQDIRQVFSSNAVQNVALNASQPVFIATHPRVTTTVRFPGVISAPMGNGFTEDPAKQAGEYMVSWVEGEQHFTVTPCDGAGPCNLNVPYKGQIFVLYFYPVSAQSQAAAVVNLIERQGGAAASAEVAASVEVKRQAMMPAAEFLPVTPARLLGFLDKVKVLHTCAPGAELEALAKSMQCDVAISQAEVDGAASASMQGVVGVIRHAVNDAGLYQLVLVRAVRDRRLNCVAFAMIIRNTSSVAIALDTASFCARTGATLLPQVLTDSPAIVGPGEQKEAYFVVQAGKSFPVLAQNEWRLSVELISPRLNPGAAIAARFVSEQKEVAK